MPVQSAAWTEFELLDSGEGQKLERWGKKTFIRPEPKALWRKADPAAWSNADAICDEHEVWRKSPGEQILDWRGLKFITRASAESKHLGLFPEQEPHWDWMSSHIKKGDRVLNLFGYTGSASLVAAQAGATVTHIDASKPSVLWARENAQACGMSDAPIRWIVEDTMTYLKREERRGSRYEAIMLDPPSFGRGPKGELWKIEAIAELLDQCKRVLSDNPSFVILTMYNLEASALTLANLLEIFKTKARVEVGELALKEKGRDRYLPLSLYGRANWH